MIRHIFKGITPHGAEIGGETWAGLDGEHFSPFDRSILMKTLIECNGSSVNIFASEHEKPSWLISISKMRAELRLV